MERDIEGDTGDTGTGTMSYQSLRQPVGLQYPHVEREGAGRREDRRPEGESQPSPLCKNARSPQEPRALKSFNIYRFTYWSSV